MITQTRPGRYGEFGGQYLPETLMPAVAELEAAWLEARADAEFQRELARILRDWVGRPMPLTDAPGKAEFYRSLRKGQRPPFPDKRAAE